MHAQLSLPLVDAAGPPVDTAVRPVSVPTPSIARNGPRLAELLVGLSHALDMCEGHAAGHALRSCWIGQQIGRALGLATREMRELFYATLLKDAGGSANAVRLHALFLIDDRRFKRARRRAGSGTLGQLRLLLGHTAPAAGPGVRLRAILNAIQNGGEIARELAETRAARGAQLARQLRFGSAVAEGIQSLEEHWDGSGQPEALAGEEIPLYARIAALAQLVDARHGDAGPQAAREAVARHAGRTLDPRLATVFAALARDAAFWSGLAAEDLEQRLHDSEPARAPEAVDDGELDDIALAFGQVVDAKSAFTGGHSARVALIADQLCLQFGLDHAQRRWLRRGALLHDIGKLGIGNAILDKPAPLDAWEQAEMQRHASATEQVLGRIASFGALARVAGAHHEKLDGSGYPRGLDARHIRLETRIVTTADVFDALTTDRPWRAAMSVDRALAVMQDEVGSTVDADCLAALQRSHFAR